MTRNGRALVLDFVMATRTVRASTMRKVLPRLAEYFRAIGDKTIRGYEARAHRQTGTRSVKGEYEISLSPGMNETLWADALEEAMREAGLEYTTVLTNGIRSALDATYGATSVLLGVEATAATDAWLSQRATTLAQRITRISETTRNQFRDLLRQAIYEDDLTPMELSRKIRERFTSFSASRAACIARTEPMMAANQGSLRAMTDSGVVTHVSVVGCEAREPGSPQYNGQSTCNIENVPIKDAYQLDFHPNHTGCIVPSRMAGEDAIPYDLGEESEPPSGPHVSNPVGSAAQDITVGVV